MSPPYSVLWTIYIRTTSVWLRFREAWKIIYGAAYSIDYTIVGSKRFYTTNIAESANSK